MDELLALARQHDLIVIEDAAHAVGARFGELMVGSIGDATAFSFYATKNLTTGEGGMLTSDNVELIEKARLLSLHGMSRDAWGRYKAQGAWRYDVVAAGFKYNLSDLQAAVGLVQLDKLPRLLARRAQIHRRYTDAFSEMPGLIPSPSPPPGSQSAYHLYMLRLRPNALAIDRDGFCAELWERGIGASVHFIPVYHFAYYQERYGWHPEDYPATEAIFQSIISLPCYPRMRDQDVERVIQAVGEIVDLNKRRER
jgi:dTDP-4-amino-4,6-dideoxygalactose transaminase